MNEQAIIDSFELFQQEGYKGTIDDFKMLMANNTNALDDMFGLFVSQGYRQSKDDYSVLIGAKPPKTVKKKDITESDSEVGLLEQFKNKFNLQDAEADVREQPPVQVQDNTFIPEVKPPDVIAQVEARESKEAFDTQRAIDMEDFQKQEKLDQEAALEQLKINQSLLTQGEQFQNDLSIINANLIDQEEEEVVPKLRDKFQKYGFTFEESGLGDSMVVSNFDNTQTVTINLDPFTTETEILQSQKLKNFLSANALEQFQTNELLDFDGQSDKAQNLRRVGRINPDGTTSTVLMTSFEADGKYYAMPTLFPKNTAWYGTSPDDWVEPEFAEAKKLAEERGEIFQFDTEDEAQRFAEGAWKDRHSTDVIGKKIYSEVGLNFKAEQAKYDSYLKVRDEIDFIEAQVGDFDNDYIEELTPEQRKQYKGLYVNGQLRDDTDVILSELKETEAALYSEVSSEEMLELREKYDLSLQKKYSALAKEASGANYQAAAYEDALQVESLSTFGVRLEDLTDIQPQDEQQAELLDKFKIQKASLNAEKKHAANKYEMAKTFYSAKYDKTITDDFEEGAAAVYSELTKGLNDGNASEVILQLSTGMAFDFQSLDLDNEDDRRKAAEMIVALKTKNRGKKDSKALSRWNRAEGFRESMDAFLRNPKELALAMAANSIGMMLPYGAELVTGSTAVGAAYGGGTGAMAGGVGAVPGAIAGAATGLKVGMSLTALSMEYTNEYFAAMESNGYDVLNAKDVELAMQDDAVWALAKERGLKRGIPIALVDYLTAGLAGRVFQVGKTARRTKKIASQLAERAIFDPIGEMAGETLAQVVVGDELDFKEIAAEGIGGFGNNASMMVVNKLIDGRNNSNIELASKLTDINFIVNEKESDTRISAWTNNMLALGKINEDQAQRIQKNLGLSKDADNMLDFGASKNKPNNKKVKARLMELLSAKEEYSADTNRREVFGQKIKDINGEIAFILENKSLAPQENKAKIDAIFSPGVEVGDVRAELSQYVIDGKSYSKQEFLKRLGKMSVRELTKFNGKVANDEEVAKQLKDKIDAVQITETESVDARQQTEDSQGVGTGVPIQETTELEATETEVNPNQKYEDAVADIDQQISDLRTEDGSILPKDMKKFKALQAKRVKAKFDADRGDSDGSMSIRVEGDDGGVLVGEEAIQAENDIENYIATIEKNVTSGKITKEKGRDMIMRYVGAQGKYNFLSNEIDSMNRYVRDRLDSSIPEVGNNKSKFTDWRKGNKTVAPTTNPETKRFQDSQVILKEETFTVTNKDGGKVVTTVRTNLDGSLKKAESETFDADGNSVGKGINITLADNNIVVRDGLTAEQLLTDRLVEGEVIEKTERSGTEINNPKRIAGLTTEQKQKLGIETNTNEKTNEKTNPEVAAGNRLFSEPLQEATEIEARVKERTGIDTPKGERITKLDEERSKRISEAYEKQESNPNDPEVQAAYKALIDETIAQYEDIIAAGYTLELSNKDYKSSSEMISDLRDNKNMRIFSTEEGFGPNGITEEQRASNPKLAPTSFKDKNGKPLLANDVFRFVHDFFGHSTEGNSFGPIGEENAWNVHSRMYSPLARRAMTTETRGQNSWVNFSGVNEKAFALRDEARALRKEGKFEEAEAKVKEAYDVMIFAQQKVMLLPEEFTLLPEETPEGIALAEEAADLEASIENPSQFQLDDTSITPERKKALEDRALKLMEKVQPELSEKSFTVEETNLPTTPIVVTENTKLANKVGKMSVKDLQDKRINLVMADLLKVDEKRMGGAFFGLQEGIYGKQIAWASITPPAARNIIRGSIKSDYTVVYMMKPEAIDSNVVLLDTLTDKIKQSPNRKAIFNAMMKHLSINKFGKKTEVVNNIGKNSKTLVEFTVEFEKLDVDTKAKIFKTVLPRAGVNAGTEVGKLFQAEGISQESVREENLEQFAKDLPMGSMTMVLKITDSNGNKITKNNIDDAIVMPEQQRAEDIKEHRNYPVYIRGEVVAMLSDTVPFWAVNKNILSTIDAKIDGLIKTKTTEKERSKGAADTKPTTARQARGGAMRTASMTAGSSFVVQPSSKTNYEKFISKLTKSFPNTEVVTDQKEFDNLVSDLSAKALMTKNQKVYGAVYNGKLYLNPALENYDTPVHEFGHLWLNTAKELAPDTYKKGLSLIEGTEYEAAVRNSEAYQQVIKQMIADGATETEINEYILEEALATAIGNKGDSFASAAQKKNFRAWLNELFDFIKKLTGISKLTPEQIQDLSLDEFTDAVVVDLLSENKAFENAETAGLSDSLQLMTTSNSSMTDIINMSRDKGFSDASIKQVLKGRGFKIADITAAMEVNVDAFTQLPEAFGRVEGGVKEGMQLFKDVRESLSKFITPEKTMAEVRQKAMELMKENAVYKAQPEQTQMELLTDFDKTLNTRANVVVQKEISALRNNLRQRKINSQNLKAAQIQLRNYIRKALPKSKTYTQAQINKLVSRVSKSTVDTFQADTEYVLNIVDQQKVKMKKSLVNDMLKLVKAKAMTAFTKSGKRRAKGLSKEGTAYFKAVKQILTADVDQLNEIQEKLQAESGEINSLIEKQLDGDTLTQKEQAKVNLALAMDTFGDVSNMSFEEVQGLMQQLKDVRADSIATFKSRRLARVEANKAMKAEADEQIKDTNPMLFDADGNVLNKNERNARKNEILSHFRNFEIGKAFRELGERMAFSTAKEFIQSMKQMFQHLGTLSNVLDRVTQGKNFFTKNVYDALNRMDDLNNGGLFQTQKKLDDIANTIPGITKGVKQVYSKLNSGVHVLKLKRSDTGREYTDSFNADELMRIYALSLNDTQRQKLEAQDITPEVIENIKSIIGPEAVEFADKSVNFLSNEYFEGVNDVYSYVNDVNLGYVNNYFPTSTIQKETTKKMITDGDFSGVFNAESAPAFKERVDMRSDVDLHAGTFTSVLNNHVQTMEKYKAYAVGTKRLNALFKIDSVNVLLEEMGVAGSIKNAVNFAVNPDSGKDSSLNPSLISRLQTQFTGFALAFKAIQILKQSTSFVNAYSDYSYFSTDSKVPRVVQAAVDLPMFMFDGARVVLSLAKDLVGKNGAIREAMEISPTFRKRVIQGLEGDIVGLESGRQTFKKTALTGGKLKRAQAAFKTAAASPTIIGDVLGVMGYMINYKRNIANGMSKAEAVKAFNDYNATQQSRRGTDKIPLQRNNNVFVRGFTMFGSTLFLQMNKVMQSTTNITRDVANKKRPRSKDTRDLALNLAVANVLFATAANIAKFIKGDDEDKETAMKSLTEAVMGLNLIYQLPYLGSMVKDLDIAGQVIAGVKGEEYKRGRIYTSDVVNPFASVLQKYKKLTKNDENKVGAAVRTLTEITIGAQIDPFIGLYNYFAGEEEDVDPAMYDVMGISPSYRPKNEGSKDKSMSKQDMKKFMPGVYEDLYGPGGALAPLEQIKKDERKRKRDLQKMMDEAMGLD